MRTAHALTVPASMLCAGGVYLVQEGGVPGPGGVYLVRGVYLSRGGCTWSQGGCTWSWGVYLVWESVPGLGGVPGPRQGGVPGPLGCTWSQGGVPGPGGCTWSGGVPGLGGCTWLGGVCSRGYLVPRGVPGPRRGCTWSGVYLVPGGLCLVPGGTWSQGGTCPGTRPPPVNRILDTRL